MELTPLRTCSVTAWGRNQVERRNDRIAVEEPLEIRVVHGPRTRRSLAIVSVTMRTPGNDEELAIGFLVSEGLLRQRGDVEQIEIRGSDEHGNPTGNVVRVHLRPDVPLDLAKMQRNFLTTSSCGVCGKASLDALAVAGLEPLPLSAGRVAAEVIRQLPAGLRARQPIFAETGGLHGSALCSYAGEFLAVREDIGRHNAVDKLIGRAFLAGDLPVGDRLLVVSGRVSFEILQKGLVARIPCIVAVGAPSSLAVETAARFNLTLIGFASAERFNVYAGGERLDPGTT